MKKKNGKQVPNCVPEAYDMGHDYAMHTQKVTPGQAHYDPKYQGGSYKPSKKENNNIQAVTTKQIDGYVTKKDIEEWAVSEETIDKYRSRYGEEWKTKLETVIKIMKGKLD